ncbi:MAG TPA: hypothetical protein VF092_19760 [Longimicrobium sp.]
MPYPAEWPRERIDSPYFGSGWDDEPVLPLRGLDAHDAPRTDEARRAAEPRRRRRAGDRRRES